MSAMTDLPVPDPAFRWSVESWGTALRCGPLEPLTQHLFTTRQLQLRGAGDQDARWEQAARAAGGDSTQLIRVRQVHGRSVRVVRRGMDAGAETQRKPDADAIASNAPGALLAVQVADCVPVLIADARSGAASAVHAGWRGMSARVAQAAVETLGREFGSKPADLVAAIGPSIGPCCYEVGTEVAEAFRADGATDEEIGRWFRRDAGALWLDLWAACRDQLLGAGLLSARVYVCGLCTKTHSHVFDSYRVDGPNAGRMAAIIQVPVR